MTLPGQTRNARRWKSHVAIVSPGYPINGASDTYPSLTNICGTDRGCHEFDFLARNKQRDRRRFTRNGDHCAGAAVHVALGVCCRHDFAGDRVPVCCHVVRSRHARGTRIRAAMGPFRDIASSRSMASFRRRLRPGKRLEFLFPMARAACCHCFGSRRSIAGLPRATAYV